MPSFTMIARGGATPCTAISGFLSTTRTGPGAKIYPTCVITAAERAAMEAGKGVH
jgi:hypothetical protein